MSKLRDQVMEFHAVLGQPIGVYPRVIDDDRVRLRAALVVEECFEMLEAMFGEGASCLDDRARLMETLKTNEVRVDMVALADALADIDYVVEGTRIEFGIDGGPIADEVHRSNMAKVGGPVSPTGKKMKPPGWTPPDVAHQLHVQGWGDSDTCMTCGLPNDPSISGPRETWPARWLECSHE